MSLPPGTFQPEPSPECGKGTGPLQGMQALRSLNAHLRQMAGPAASPQPTSWPALRSLQGFREAWSGLQTQQQLGQALQQLPANAGPLNSQRLLLQTLASLHALSPAYTRHWLRHQQALLALDGLDHRGSAATSSARPAVNRAASLTPPAPRKPRSGRSTR